MSFIRSTMSLSYIVYLNSCGGIKVKLHESECEKWRRTSLPFLICVWDWVLSLFCRRGIIDSWLKGQEKVSPRRSDSKLRKGEKDRGCRLNHNSWCDSSKSKLNGGKSFWHSTLYQTNYYLDLKLEVKKQIWIKAYVFSKIPPAIKYVLSYWSL